MPAVFLDRLPLPSLQAYTAGSLLLLGCSLHYALQVTSELNGQFPVSPANATLGLRPTFSVFERGFIKRAVEVLYFMLQEPMCIWTLINMTYCCFILVGKVIQKLVFGDLRVSEQQHIKDKFWNFVFYKFIFIFGVMNVQFMDEVVLWCSWFSILGFLHLLAQLCKDRCEYLSFSPTATKWTHCRVLALLSGILSMSLSLFGICVFVGLHAGINTFAFMAAECSLVIVRTLYVITRYAIYLLNATHEDAWEKKASCVYYTELGFELAALIVDFLHHLHMLVWGNIFLSMASLVIAMQLRCLFYEIKHRLKKYKNYLRIVKYMECNYPMATAEELEKNNDDCAICWDHLDSARKLPCLHLFHNSCLRSWLEQDTSCPTCRKALNDNSEKDINADVNNYSNVDIIHREAEENSNNHSRNQFFHFDGSQYISWLPSFFVEVSHPDVTGEHQFSSDPTSQLDSMAHQIQQMFPHMSMNNLLDDLRVTKSMELTVENILEGKLVSPPPVFQRNYSQNVQDSWLQTLDNRQASLCLNTKKLYCSEFDNIKEPIFPVDAYDSGEIERCPGITQMYGASPLGCRFSKSPQERERILAQRKEDFIKTARRRYLNKTQNVSDSS